MYLLSGARPPQAGPCPAIVADFYEDTSSRCTSDCGGELGIPGNMIHEQSLGSGATWSVNISVVYAGNSRPGIDIYAFCDANQNGRLDRDETCVASTSLSAGSHDGVTFDRDICPGRT